jgi:hypothetical protein
MKNLRYICVQPRIKYYTWQVEVVIHNFKKLGINLNNLDILVATNSSDDTSSEENIAMWRKLANTYNYVRFFFYEDSRVVKNYIPSVYFNILKQHIKAYPELENEALFLFDCDTIFTKPLDLSPMINDDKWYLSDTVGYIGYQYIKTKMQPNYDVYNGMCKIVGIDPLIPKLLNSNSGGAQHLVKNTTYEYWDKVEKDSIEMYNYFVSIEPDYEKTHEGDFPIQKWTAGMWSLLWNAWLFGHETIVDKRLDFSWATDPIDYWDQRAIYHNAGVTCSCGGNFYKGAYINELPYGYDLRIKDTRCNYNYYQEIKEVESKSCLLEWSSAK